MPKNDSKNNLDIRIREAFTKLKKLDDIDLKILQGLSLHGSRNISSISNHLKLPTTTVWYRLNRMLSDSILFLHSTPNYSKIGLKPAFVFLRELRITSSFGVF